MVSLERDKVLEYAEEQPADPYIYYSQRYVDPDKLPKSQGGAASFFWILYDYYNRQDKYYEEKTRLDGYRCSSVGSFLLCIQCLVG